MGIRAALAVHGPAGRFTAAVADRLRTAVEHLELVEANTVAQARELMTRARDSGLGARGELKVWDVATWSLVRTLDGHTRAVLAVAFAPDGV